MKITITQLASTDLGAVDELMKRYSQTLGFLPWDALQDYLEKGYVLGAKTNEGCLVGYLLYGVYPNHFRITQLCVSEEYQRQGIASRLVNDLKDTATTQKVIKLNCRRDFPANDLWPKLGFVALSEKPSRSGDGYFLAIWQLALVKDAQLQIFQAKTSSEALDIIIDAHIFFDFDEPDIDKTIPSKALLSDFLVDSLELWITDELLNEIHRQENPEKRKKNRNRAQNFSTVESDPRLVEEFGERLKEILPNGKPSQKSDIKHLAKAAASNVKIFVTRDGNLLKNAKKIADLTGLEVVNPAELIIQLHELSERQSYAPDRIAGLNLRWDRLTSNDLADVPFDFFLNRERKGKFREKLESLVVQPDCYECELLRSGDNIFALRVLTKNSNQMLLSPLARVAFSANSSLFGRFLIADTVSKAVEQNLNMVKFETSALTPSLIPALLEMGFVECNNNFVRFCFSRCVSRENGLAMISELCPESKRTYQDMSDFELERRCSPLILDSIGENCFLIPILPDYAMGLIDRHQSAEDLFGGDPNVLLRWNNVYYRKVSHHKMLKAPGRILWYASRRKKQIIAVSHLDDVVINTAKELFRKFKRFGVLEWRDLYRMCGRDSSKELMVLQFSHTFLFRKPISLDDIRTVYAQNDAGLSLQGP
ncbi:GNAT family N-acetyltransferase, partial [Candidatus Poribacteria bacterium]|nr:GNAT family N-acetyltransferase [Candidatus Poribacteria bacterium]